MFNLSLLYQFDCVTRNIHSAFHKKGLDHLVLQNIC